MTTLSFDLEQAYSGDEIIVGVGLLATSGESVIDMKLDTGASISTMHHSYLALLGVDDVETGVSSVLSSQTATAGRHGFTL